MNFLEPIGRDLVLAMRSLRRSPVFALSVITTIAIGMGAVAAVLSILDLAYLRRYPVPEPERVVRIWTQDSTRAMRWLRHGSFADFRDVRASVIGLDGLAAYSMGYVKLGGDQAGLDVYSAFVSANYFSVLRVTPALGRYFLPDEEEPRGAHPIVVMSDMLWRTSFGADAGIVGRRITIGAGEFTVVGIAPPGFTGIQPEGRTDLWIPYTMNELARGRDVLYEGRDARQAMFFGRLAQGATVAMVQGSLDNAARALAAAHPVTNRTIWFQAAQRERMVEVSDAPASFAVFLIVLGMVGLVHLIACGNVASLLLARGAARRRELGVRICLGATRARVMLQSLAEPAVLAVIGAVGAAFVARGATRAIGSMWFMSALEPALDLRMFAIVIAVAVITVLQFGMLPALMAARTDPIEVVHGVSRGIRGMKSPTSGALIVGQVAMSVLLLAQASLLIGKFRRETTVDPGFDYRHLVVASVNHPDLRASRSHWLANYEAAIERVASLPGVTRVAASDQPALQVRWMEEVVPQNAVDAASRSYFIQAIGPGYFSAIGARMVEGREFTRDDRRVEGPTGGFDAVVVNETFARLSWPDRSAVGQTLHFRKKPVQIVGVVADQRDARLSTVAPRVYFPLLQWRLNAFSIVAAVNGDQRAAVARIQAALRSLPETQPPSVRPMRELHESATELSRVMALSLSITAAIALLLTAIGLYGAVTIWSATRRRELGVRIALGARARHVYGLLMSDAGKLAAIGLGLGVAGSAALVKVEQSRFGPGLSPDAPAVVLVLAILVLVLTVSAVVPARKATKLQPTEVMRPD